MESPTQDKQNSPRVSIVIPTRNRPDILRNCLEAVQAQSFVDYEVIVVEDGSDDPERARYQELINGFDDRFMMDSLGCRVASGTGPSQVRNRGLAQARGAYVAFCDDDDLWTDPDYLTDSVTALDAADGKLLLGNQRAVAGGKVVKESWMPALAERLAAAEPGTGLGIFTCTLDDILAKREYAHVNMIVARKDLVDRIGGFWESVRYAEDVDFFVRLADATDKILFRPKVAMTHHAPDPASTNTASTNIPLVDRQLAEAYVYLHLLAVCNTAAGRAYARFSDGTNLKLLVASMEKERRAEAAAVFAHKAFAARPSFRWAIHALLLFLSSARRRRG